MRTARKH